MRYSIPRVRSLFYKCKIWSGDKVLRNGFAQSLSRSTLFALRSTLNDLRSTLNAPDDPSYFGTRDFVALLLNLRFTFLPTLTSHISLLTSHISTLFPTLNAFENALRSPLLRTLSAHHSPLKSHISMSLITHHSTKGLRDSVTERRRDLKNAER